MSFPKMRRNNFPSPVHNLMVVEELESENYAGRVKPEIGQKGEKKKLSSIHWPNHITNQNRGVAVPAVLTIRTQRAALWRRQCGCASSGRPQPCTPWQSTRVLESGSTPTSWPGKGGATCSRSQRCVSHTLDCERNQRQEVDELKRHTHTHTCFAEQDT